MYAIAIIRYRRPLDEVLPHTDAHRAYLGRLQVEGVVLAAGPLDPRTGGALLLRVPGDDAAAASAALDRVRDGDPYVTAGVAQYELLPWRPGIGADALERL